MTGKAYLTCDTDYSHAAFHSHPAVTGNTAKISSGLSQGKTDVHIALCVYSAGTRVLPMYLLKILGQVLC